MVARDQLVDDFGIGASFHKFVMGEGVVKLVKILCEVAVMGSISTVLEEGRGILKAIFLHECNVLMSSGIHFIEAMRSDQPIEFDVPVVGEILAFWEVTFKEVSGTNRGIEVSHYYEVGFFIGLEACLL